MVFLELAAVAAGIGAIKKINSFPKLTLLFCWLFSICMPQLFIVVSNHSILRSPKNWLNTSAYFVYLSLLLPVLTIISVNLIFKQKSWIGKLSLYLLCGIVLTCSFYLMLPIGILRLEHFHPLVAWPIWMLSIYLTGSVTESFGYSFKKV